MARRARQVIRHTVLVVVEGETEFAFCLHLKAHLSHGRNIQVNIRNAHGGSPDKIVAFARRELRQTSYDSVLIIFDADLNLSKEALRTAKSIKARLVQFSPCIEAWYLRLMGQTPPSDTVSCKKRFHEIGLDEKRKCEREAYTTLFPLDRFTELAQNPQFAALIKVFSNQ